MRPPRYDEDGWPNLDLCTSCGEPKYVWQLWYENVPHGQNPITVLCRRCKKDPAVLAWRDEDNRRKGYPIGDGTSLEAKRP